MPPSGARSIEALRSWKAGHAVWMPGPTSKVQEAQRLPFASPLPTAAAFWMQKLEGHTVEKPWSASRKQQRRTTPYTFSRCHGFEWQQDRTTKPGCQGQQQKSSSYQHHSNILTQFPTAYSSSQGGQLVPPIAGAFFHTCITK